MKLFWMLSYFVKFIAIALQLPIMSVVVNDYFYMCIFRRQNMSKQTAVATFLNDLKARVLASSKMFVVVLVIHLLLPSEISFFWSCRFSTWRIGGGSGYENWDKCIFRVNKYTRCSRSRAYLKKAQTFWKALSNSKFLEHPLAFRSVKIKM